MTTATRADLSSALAKAKWIIYKKWKDASAASRRPFRLMGVDFAPLSIPWERRLQTASVIVCTAFFAPMALYAGAFLFYLAFFTRFQWVPLLYLAWVAYDWNVGERGGRKNKFVRKWELWRRFAAYFPMKLVRSAELPTNKSYLMGVHPHGILSFGAFCSFATDALDAPEVLPGLQTTLLTLPEQFRLLGSREVLASAGICSSTKQSMEYLLGERKEGHATVLVVGGALEALNHSEKEIRLVLNRRKGFVKLALRFGRDLVPVFSFGENFIYGQADNPEGSLLRKFQDWFERHLSFSPPLFYGRGVFQYTFGMLPYRRPVTVVVGRPIPVPRVEEPTSEQILDMHAKYVRGLQELYEEYNPIYGDPKVKLVVA